MYLAVPIMLRTGRTILLGGYCDGDKTITEMIFVDDEIRDGLYLLKLQMPAFHTDAAPCRPVIYALT